MEKILETKRLILRKLTPEDTQALLDLFTDGGMPHLAQFGPLDSTYVHGFLNRWFTSYQDNGFGLWAVIEKATGKFIGYCGLHKITITDKDATNPKEKVELAYRIHKTQWGNGFATEAANAVRDYAFKTLLLPEIVSCIANDNIRSMRVAEKVGLTYTTEVFFRGLPHRLYVLKNDDTRNHYND